MSNIVKHEPTNSLSEKKDWAQAMSTGDLLPRQYQGKPGNLLFACEYADALGISRVHVLTSIAVINGRPSPSADLMAAMVRAHGHKLRVWGNDTEAHAELIRSDDPDFTFKATWDINKAKKANLWGNKGPWSLYPSAMLRARAISEVVRLGAQDVMAGGIYTPEELGAVVDDSGIVTHLPQQATAERADKHTQQQATNHIKNTLGAQETTNDIPQDAITAVENATSEADLNHIYETHKAESYWEKLKPMLTSRKHDLANEAIADQAEDDQPTLDGELIDPEVA